MRIPNAPVDGTMSRINASAVQRHLTSTLMFSLKKDPPNSRKTNELPSLESAILTERSFQ
jgi:hypothetical protein